MATVSDIRRVTTKLGEIFSGPDWWMPSENRGAYFPCVVMGSDIPGWPAETWPILLYYSTDHDNVGNGGIGLRVWGGGSDLTAGWQLWNAVSNNAEFSHISEKSLPMFQYTNNGSQSETPSVFVSGGTVYMLFHNSGMSYTGEFHNGEGILQNTCYATSTNGIDFTFQGRVLQYDPQFEVGDGHTGYANVPLTSELLQNLYGYTYYTSALHGGGGNENPTAGTNCLWGSNDRLTWEPVKYFRTAYGRLDGIIPDDGPNHFAYRYIPDAIAPTRSGAYWRALGSYAIGNTSGATATPESRFAEYLIDDNLNVVSEPSLTMGLGGVGDFDEASLGRYFEFEYNGKTYIIYDGLDSTATVRGMGIAEVTIEPYTWTLLDDAFSDPTVVEHDFTGNTGLVTPSNVAVSTVSGSASSLAVSEDYIQLNTPPSSTGMVAVTDGVVLDQHDVIDIEFDGLAADNQGGQVVRVFAVRNSTSPTFTSQLVMYPTLSSENSPYNNRFVANSGAIVRDVNTKRYMGALNSWAASYEESQQARQRKVGFRIIPSTNTAYFIIDGVEISEIDITGMPYSDTFYPLIQFNNSAGADRKMSLERVTVKTYSLGKKSAACATPTLTATAANEGVTVSAPAVANAAGYKVLVGKDGIFTETDLGATPSGTVSGLTNGESYDVMMLAYDSSGYQSELTAAQTVAPVAAPTYDLNVRIPGIPNGDWVADLYNKTTGAVSSATLTFSGGICGYDTGATPGDEYFVIIQGNYPANLNQGWVGYGVVGSGQTFTSIGRKTGSNSAVKDIVSSLV